MLSKCFTTKLFVGAGGARVARLDSPRKVVQNPGVVAAVARVEVRSIRFRFL